MFELSQSVDKMPSLVHEGYVMIPAAVVSSIIAGYAEAIKHSYIDEMLTDEEANAMLFVLNQFLDFIELVAVKHESEMVPVHDDISGLDTDD